MSQSFANTNSFSLELGQGNPIERVWDRTNFQAPRFEPFKGYSRFLRYPSSVDGLGYRATRVGVIAVLRMKGFLRISRFNSKEISHD